MNDKELIERFHLWFAGVQGYIKEGNTLGFKINRKWIKVWKEENDRKGRSLYAWIDRATGEIIRSGGWKIPGPKWTKVAHPNLKDNDYGVGGCDWFGPLYCEQYINYLAKKKVA